MLFYLHDMEKKKRKIKMTRDGEVRYFSASTLLHWPDDYYGWQQVKEDVPAVVSQNMEKQAPTRGRKPAAKPMQSGDPLEGIETENEFA